MAEQNVWLLMGADAKLFPSSEPGTLGGHRRGKRYGKLDCRAARQAIARGGYVKNRVFFSMKPPQWLRGFVLVQCACPPNTVCFEDTPESSVRVKFQAKKSLHRCRLFYYLAHDLDSNRKLSSCFTKNCADLKNIYPYYYPN